MLGLLIASLVIFLVGMIQTLGYNGTTSLQPVATSDKAWTDFYPKLFSSGQSKGAPYSWVGSQPKVENNIVKFDKRLIRVLTYIKQTGNASCVWNSTHEKIGLSVDSPEFSDLITAPYKQQSISTLFRGTGARITSADEVKCTIKPRQPTGGLAGAASAATGNKCAYQQPTVFDSKSISLLSNVTVLPDKPYDIKDCEVNCAVDYYPDKPLGASDTEVPVVSSDALNNLNPSYSSPFKYEDITQKTREAGIYKTAQLMYEIMRIDDPNCETSAGNVRGDRAIPITVIAQNWVVAELKDTWQDFLKLAEGKFRFTFQSGSPLAGLTFDKNLDDKGLQINF